MLVPIPPPKSYVEILPSDVMECGGGAWGDNQVTKIEPS